MASAAPEAQWQKTACILCSLNCGLDVQVGGPGGRHLVKIKGDRDHPVSRGYFCEKAQRLDFYQTAGDRLDSPLRRRPDGGFEAIDWDTAIREVAAKLADIKARHGGDKILYYGGGGQGNHLGGSYGSATLAALGNRYRSNALAQEKTGEFWVNGRMIGAGTHGDFDHCEVAVFIGKNPWQSHGFARARATLREIARDPKRAISRHRSAPQRDGGEGDFHLAIRPGTTRGALAALDAINRARRPRCRPRLVAEHTRGFDEIETSEVPCRRRPAAYCRAVRRRRGVSCGRVADASRCGERLRLRGPRHADVGALDARELVQRLDLALDRQLRPEGHELRARCVRRAHGRSKAERRGHGDDRAEGEPGGRSRRSSPGSSPAT
jgi:hypothetical protein